MAQLELGCLPHFESNAASSDLSASCFSGSFPTTPHSGTCITSGSVLKLHLEEMCKQPYLAGQPGLLGEITATPPRSHFFTQCCYCKAQHTWKYFYITGLGKKLKVFSSILCIICTSFWQQNTTVFLIIFLYSTYMFPLAYLEIWEADGPNEGWICERRILMYETSEDELSRKRGRQQEPQKVETRSKRNNA